jgi:hypothetical protein
LSSAAKTGWLTLSFWRIATISRGLMAFSGMTEQTVVLFVNVPLPFDASHRADTPLKPGFNESG